MHSESAHGCGQDFIGAALPFMWWLVAIGMFLLAPGATKDTRL